MSRTTFLSGNWEVVVGWDPPLGTFFGDVTSLLDDSIAFEIYDKEPMKVVQALREWLTTEEMIHGYYEMTSARNAAQNWEPGELQRRFGLTGGAS